MKVAMKKITFFLTDLGGGGAERVMLNLANGLVEQGFAVDLVLVNVVGAYLSRVHSDIKIVTFNTTRLARCIPELVGYLKKAQPDVFMTALEDTNLVGILACRLAKILAGVRTQVVVSVHNNLSQEAQNLNSLKRRWVPKLIRWVYPFADLVIAVSNGVADDLAALGIRQSQIRVIYNPIVTPDFYAQAEESPEHDWFTGDSPISVILGVGRLEKQKDFATLIRAYSIVKQQLPARLMILGEGSEQEKLMGLCRQLQLGSAEVTFPGFVDNPLAYMSGASVCVLSSAWEGFGNVLVESMGVGTPVVSTDCPSGPAEILADGVYGPLVPVSDVQQMAAAIVETLKRPVASHKLQTRAADFSLQTVLKAYREALAI